MLKKLLTLFLLLQICIACSTPSQQQASIFVQGIIGTVNEVSGNQMPSPNMPSPVPKPLKTTVYIYTLTHISETQQLGLNPFFSKINTKFVDSVITDNDGHFKKELPTGKYSVFIKVNGLFFANSYDIENNIQPVEVEAKKWVEVKISLNHKAVY